MDILKLTKYAFEEATDEVMNGENAINLSGEINKERNSIKVWFDFEWGDNSVIGGNSVTYRKNGIFIDLEDPLGGCGVEDEMLEILMPMLFDILENAEVPMSDFEKALWEAVNYEQQLTKEERSILSYPECKKLVVERLLKKYDL